MKETDIKPIKWKFNPPTAAWWGGWWERLVRVIKELLKRTLGKPGHDFKVGDVVMIEEPSKKRVYWPLGKVISLLPGRDGKVRTLKLKITIDAAVVQKNSLRVDELLSKLVNLEEQLASLKLQRKFQSSRPHHHQRSRSRSKSRRRYNPQGRYCFYHLRFGKKCLPGRKFRLFVKDRETRCQFLVDSGADVSILPWTKTKGECQASQYKLYAANGTEIPTYGLKILTLDLGLRRPFQWPFIIAKVKRGIIGADFLQKFQLLIDLHNRKLIDGVTNLSIKGEVATIQESNDLSTVNRASKYFNLLKLYPDLTKPNLVNRVVKHGVKHHILTTGQPVYSKARQLAPDKLKLAKQEFQFMLDNDIIRPSKSQWASPLHLVNKKDGTLRPCGDYRRLNAQTIPDRYPIPRIEDFNYILKDKKYFPR
ncbi:transposon Ty3-G Gag-Pol polyprotein [Trichonephila clavipes]|nr:transposon Ty3-G Gag-Pol polyprotein [Trichonephila clavipes]